VKKEEFFRHARQDRKGPLDGMVVVEATTTWAGPMVACLLADYGARVIKIEHPTGDVIRRLPPLLPNSSLSVLDQTVNRNKECLTLDLHHPKAKEIFLQLTTKADVVVENFKPGTMASWGVGYEDVKAVKPDVVYISISAFGQFGEHSDRPGYDPIAQNYTGWTSLNGDPDGDPVKAPTFLGDDLAGIHGALGALAALRHRDISGEGQHVDVSLVDSLLYHCNGQLTCGALGLEQPRLGNQFGMAAPVDNYACKDGNVLAGVLLDSHWVELAKLLGREDLSDLKIPDRLQRRDELNDILAAWCAARTVAEVETILMAKNLIVTKVNDFRDTAKETHIHDRDMLQDLKLTDGSEVPITNSANKFSRTPTNIRSHAPSIGEHTDSILSELGYGASEMKLFKEDKVI